MNAGPQLTVAMRACLLRAARARLMQIQEDFSVSGDPVLFEEIACVTRAIQWLWLQPTVRDE